MRVTFALNFRSHVVGRSHCRISQFSISFVVIFRNLCCSLCVFEAGFCIFLQVVSQFLGADFSVFAEAKIGELDVSVDVEQHVVGFEVPVNVLHLVNRIQRQQYLSGIELRFLVGEDVLFHEKVHEVAPRQVLHDKVEVVVVLEGALEGDHPWIFVSIRQHVAFLARLHHFVLEDHLAFLQFLDCDRLVAFVPLAQPHLPEGTLADYFERFEVVYGYLLAVFAQLCGLLVTNLPF